MLKGGFKLRRIGKLGSRNGNRRGKRGHTRKIGYNKEDEIEGGRSCKVCELEPNIREPKERANMGKTDFGVEPLGSPPKSPRALKARNDP